MPMAKPAILQEQPDFSLVLGGPLFQLFRRGHLSGDTLELLHRRVILITVIAWVPLLLLSAFEGHALDGGIRIPFLYDIEAHIRFLVALPVLIFAELVVHQRIRPTVLKFIENGIVTSEEMPKFHAAISATMRLRNSATAEIALVIAVYTVGLWVWRSQVALGAPSWYALPDGTQMHSTLAGYWYLFVSLPLFQFILLRWYLRFFLWFAFLWRVSLLKLRLIPTHPDKAGGLGFLGRSTYAFAPILFAQGALLGGLIASQIFFAAQSLMAFKLEIAGLVAFFIVIVLSPLMVFSPNLAQAKRQGLADFGTLASRYAREFEEKWFHRNSSTDDELLGSGDIQSLADLGNSYGVVQEMRFVPFGWKDATRLGAATVAPLWPLALTIYSPDELVSYLIKVLF